MKKYIIILLLIFTACKPKQVINDRYITEVDSTSILALKEVIWQQWQEIDQIKATSDRLRSENATLINETHRHEINYDTGASVIDGKYPISSEVISTGKSVLEKTIKEQETLIQEYEREVEGINQRNMNLQYQTDQLRSEVKELKSKSVRTFHLKSFIYGVVAGIIITIILIKL